MGGIHTCTLYLPVTIIIILCCTDTSLPNTENAATLVNESTGEQTVIIIQPGTDQDEITRKLMDGTFTISDLHNATLSSMYHSSVVYAPIPKPSTGKLILPMYSDTVGPKK